MKWVGARQAVIAVPVLTLVLALSGLGTSPGAVQAAAQVKLYLSNSFVGNDWRVQMQNVALAASKKAPFVDRFAFRIVDTENTPEAQAASIDDMVRQGVKVILVDASSATALNDVIERACTSGVLVLSFDQIVTAPCAYKIDTDFSRASAWGALYLAKAIKGQGNVIFDRGLPGAPISKVLEDGGKSVFARYPGIKIVCQFNGQYAEGPTQQGVASCLAANPKVDAVYTQGYCTSVVRAFEAASRSMVPMYCQAYNGNYLELLKSGRVGIVTVNPPGLSALAMWKASQVLDGQAVPKILRLDPPVYVTDTSIDIGVPTKKIKVGDVAFPNLPPGLTFPLLPPGLPFTVTVEETMMKK